MLVRSINESSFKRFSYLKWMPFTQISGYWNQTK